MVIWNKQNPLEEHFSHALIEGRSSSSSSSNQSEHGLLRTGSSPLAVPGRRLVVPVSLSTLLSAGVSALSPCVLSCHRFTAEHNRSSSSLSTDYGSWQIVSGCGSIHDHAHFPPPLASAASSSALAAAFDSPLPFSFQEEGAGGRM